MSYPYATGYWLCYSCGRQLMIGQGCNCYNQPRLCGAQHPEHPDVFCSRTLGSISSICYQHFGLLSDTNGGVTFVYWITPQPPIEYKLTVSGGISQPIEEDFTLDEICEYVLNEDFTGEFFANGKRITKQMKELMRKYKAIKELVGDNYETD